MKIVICGAGLVGYSIASYLSEEDNHVTVIDQDSALLSKITDDLDVSGIVGHASNPDTLNEANTSEADLLIAVTRSDEVNMMACQVGHSLFGVPKKIARIRDPAYLKPEWSNLFSRTHMPIDVIISPENIIAEDICSRLSVPGATYAANVSQGAMQILGVVCDGDCPVLGASLGEVRSLFPQLKFRIVSILRKGQSICAADSELIEEGDEVFFIADGEHVNRTMSAFGFEQGESRRIIIAGGGNVGAELVSLLRKRGGNEQIRIIETDEKRAQFLSERFGDTVILHGSSLEKEILQQVSVAKADTFIATTNHDETNILSSLLAKQYGADRSITLVTNNAYSPLVGPLGVDCMVSPRALLVASIMRHIRRGRIQQIHNLRHGFAEVIEAEVSESAEIAGNAIKDLDLPKSVMVAAIMRDGEVVLPNEDEIITPKDLVVMFLPQEHAPLVEKLFSIHVDIF